jgi:transposase
MSHKLRKADDALLLALACGLNAEQAAKQVGVSVSTAYRRLDDPAFRARLDELRRDMLSRASAMLTAAAVEAVRTLADLLKPANGPSVRLNAARSVLEHGVKLRGLVEVEGQLADLEARVKDAEDRGGGGRRQEADYRPAAVRGD